MSLESNKKGKQYRRRIKQEEVGEKPGGGLTMKMWEGKRDPIFSLSGTGIYTIVQSLGGGSNISVLKGVPACLERVC